MTLFAAAASRQQQPVVSHSTLSEALSHKSLGEADTPVKGTTGWMARHSSVVGLSRTVIHLVDLLGVFICEGKRWEG